MVGGDAGLPVGARVNALIDGVDAYQCQAVLPDPLKKCANPAFKKVSTPDHSWWVCDAHYVLLLRDFR